LGHYIESAEHGGPLTAISWATIILMASIAGDLLKPIELMQTLKHILLFSLHCIVCGVLIIAIILVSKMDVSSNYVMVSSGLSGLVFLCFLYLNDKVKIPTNLLQSLGRNALLIFLVHYVLIIFGHRLLHAESALFIVILGTVFMLFICTLLAKILDEKKLYLKI